jgi:hypothetical protein
MGWDGMCSCAADVRFFHAFAPLGASPRLSVLAAQQSQGAMCSTWNKGGRGRTGEGGCKIPGALGCGDLLLILLACPIHHPLPRPCG